jgi:hypothetical protein
VRQVLGFMEFLPRGRKVVAVLVVMAVVTAVLLFLVASGHSLWFANVVHVGSAFLWTGTDLFGGFVVLPLLRRVSDEQRLQLVGTAVFWISTAVCLLTITTLVAGGYIASRYGFLSLPYPDHAWLLVAGAVGLLLAAGVIGLVLPLGVLIVYGLARSASFIQNDQRFMRDISHLDSEVRRLAYVLATEGVIQVGLIVVMARITTL